MRGKQEESARRKPKPPVPSTGRGAASAMDALIKRRVDAPAPDEHALPVKSKKH